MWNPIEILPGSPAEKLRPGPADLGIFDPAPLSVEGSGADDDEDETDDTEDGELEDADFDDDDFDDDFEDDFEDELEEELEKELQEELAGDNLNSDAASVEVDPDDALEEEDF